MSSTALLSSATFTISSLMCSKLKYIDKKLLFVQPNNTQEQIYSHTNT